MYRVRVVIAYNLLQYHGYWFIKFVVDGFLFILIGSGERIYNNFVDSPVECLLKQMCALALECVEYHDEELVSLDAIFVEQFHQFVDVPLQHVF